MLATCGAVQSKREEWQEERPWAETSLERAEEQETQAERESGVRDTRRDLAVAWEVITSRLESIWAF